MLKRIVRASLRHWIWTAPAAVVVSCALGVWWSQSYWRYPFVPPSWRSDVTAIKSVDAFQEIDLRGWNDYVPVFGEHGPAAVEKAAERYRQSNTDFSAGMLAHEILRSEKPIASSLGIEMSMFHEVRRRLDERGVLVAGDPGYQNAKALRGVIALVTTTRGERMLFASLNGLEASNDHYPQYQAVFSLIGGELQLVRTRTYFSDIAGIEGARWWHIAIAAAFVMLPIAILAPLAWVTVVAVRSRRMAAA